MTSPTPTLFTVVIPDPLKLSVNLVAVTIKKAVISNTQVMTVRTPQVNLYTVVLI